MLKPDFSNYQIEKNLLTKVVVLVDTREQENKHVLDYFDKKSIIYREKKLEQGDYGLLLLKNEQFGISCDYLLDYTVERKGSLEEVSGNFTNDRDRIEKELWRGNGKMSIVIENGSLDKIIKSDYNTQYNNKSFISTIFSFKHRYNIDFNFTSKENSGYIIFTILYYKLRETIKE